MNLHEILRHVEAHLKLPREIGGATFRAMELAPYIDLHNSGGAALTTLGEMELEELDATEYRERVEAIARELVAFANKNNSINLTGHLAEAVRLARAMGAKPVVYAVETATAGGWEDCWTENDEPLRFNSRASAEQAIKEHLQDVRRAVRKGDMQSGYSKRDFRVVEVAS